jgi:hypothetical protein
VLAALLLGAVLVACNDSTPMPSAPDRLDLIEGRVVEQVDSPPYAFLRVETATGHLWTTVPIGGAGLGADVRVTGGVAVRNHLLPENGRRLEVVYFGRVAAR